MIMIVDLAEATVSFSQLREQLGVLGQKYGVVISCQHEEIFSIHAPDLGGAIMPISISMKKF